MKLNEFLKAVRLHDNLTQIEFSKKIGISLVTYNHIEKNSKYVPSYIVINKIAKYCDLEPSKIREML